MANLGTRSKEGLFDRTEDLQEWIANKLENTKAVGTRKTYERGRWLWQLFTERQGLKSPILVGETRAEKWKMRVGF